MFYLKKLDSNYLSYYRDIVGMRTNKSQNVSGESNELAKKKVHLQNVLHIQKKKTRNSWSNQ